VLVYARCAFQNLTEKCARKARAQETNNQSACTWNERTYIKLKLVLSPSGLSVPSSKILHPSPLSTGVAVAALPDTADPDAIYGVVCGAEVLVRHTFFTVSCTAAIVSFQC